MKCPLCDAEHDDFSGWDWPRMGRWPHLIDAHLPWWEGVGFARTRCWCGLLIAKNLLAEDERYTHALHRHLQANGGILQHYHDCLMGVKEYD